MRTTAALKNEFVDHPAPPQPRVQISLHYTTPVKMDLWKSRPNVLSDVVARNWRPRSVEAQHEVVVSRGFTEAKSIHEAAVLKANASLRAGMQHLLAEEKRIKEMAAAQQHHERDLVSRTTVIRNGALLVGVSTAVCWLSTVLSGTIFIHPLISTLLLLASLAFYVMSRLDS
jgi:hypothetical protein